MLNHELAIPLIPYLFSFCNNSEWSMVSKAFFKSKKTPIVHSLSTIDFVSCSCKSIRAVTALCSEGPMFRRSYVQKVLCSEGPLFRRFYVQKVLCSEGFIFRRFYVQKVPCSEIFVQKVLCLESTLAIKQYYLFNLSESVYIYNKKYVF